MSHVRAMHARGAEGLLHVLPPAAPVEVRATVAAPTKPSTSQCFGESAMAPDPPGPVRTVEYLVRAERIERSADRLERLERVGADAVFLENERRILRRLLAELTEALRYGDDPRWFDHDRANLH